MKSLLTILVAATFLISCGSYDSPSESGNEGADTASVRESPYSTPGSGSDAPTTP